MRACRSFVCVAALVLAAASARLVEARVVRVSIERREPVLDGRRFGLAGPYEKLVGTVEFALDPALPQNGAVVELTLAPRDARGGILQEGATCHSPLDAATTALFLKSGSAVRLSRFRN